LKIPVSVRPCSFATASHGFTRGNLEHFDIFCSHLGRREDEAGKEDLRSNLEILRANLMPPAEAATGIKQHEKLNCSTTLKGI